MTEEDATQDPWLREWDVVVVGTGMGGATIGHALAERGHAVLFLERGDARPAGGRPTPWAAADPAERRAHGLWPEPLSRRSGDEVQRFHPYLGCGVGGTTLLYSAALERLSPADFDGGTVDGRELPRWPVGLDALAPYYDEAERLYGADRAWPDGAPISAWDRALIAHLQSRGLQPQRLRVGIGYDADCRECMGRVCARRCKADAGTACVAPALQGGRAQVVTGCEVLRLAAGPTRVQSVVARLDGHEREFRGRVVILAAGALFSPALLLRSTGPGWPDGLANRSGLVGRNLMFHVFEVMAVSAPRRMDRRAPCTKAMVVRDFHGRDGHRLGTFQSMGGVAAGTGEIEQHLQVRWQHRPWLLSRLAKLPRHLSARALAMHFGRASLYSTSTEDAPDPANRVVLDAGEPSGIVVEYRMPPALLERTRALREALRRHFHPWRLLPLQREVQPNFGHPCGTCRFGDDPATSVLDRDNRAHGLDNLYVVDASFMPTSGAANPALTIAANARRVAPAVDAQLRLLR